MPLNRIVIRDDTDLSAALSDLITTSTIDVKTTSYTLIASDNGKIIETNATSANNITIPLNLSAPFPVGSSVDIVQYGYGQTTIVPELGVTLRSSGGRLKLSGQYSAATLYKRDFNEWVVTGDLGP